MKRILLILLCIVLLCGSMLSVAAVADEDNPNTYEVSLKKSASNVFDVYLKQTAGEDPISGIDVFVPVTNMPDTVTYTEQNSSGVFALADKTAGGFRILRSVVSESLTLTAEPALVMKVTLSDNAVVTAPTAEELKNTYHCNITNSTYQNSADFSVSVLITEKANLKQDTAIVVGSNLSVSYEPVTPIPTGTEVRVLASANATTPVNGITAAIDNNGKIVLNFSSAIYGAKVYYISLNDGSGWSESVLIHVDLLQDNGILLAKGDNETSYLRILARYNEKGAMVSATILSSTQSKIGINGEYTYKLFTLDSSFAPIFDVLVGAGA